MEWRLAIYRECPKQIQKSSVILKNHSTISLNLYDFSASHESHWLVRLKSFTFSNANTVIYKWYIKVGSAQIKTAMAPEGLIKLHDVKVRKNSLEGTHIRPKRAAQPIENLLEKNCTFLVLVVRKFPCKL